MSFFNNKFFISFLILTVAIYGLSVKTAQAGDFVGDVLGGVVNILDTVFNVVLNTIIGISELIIGGVLGVDWLSADGSCRLGNVSGKVIKTYADECGGDSGGGGGGASGSPILQDQTATPIVNSDKTGTCTTGFTLNYTVTDAYKAGIYRDGASIYQSGFLGDERVSHHPVSYWGNGKILFFPDCTPDETLAYDLDGKPVYDYKYDSHGNLISKKQRVNVFTCTKKEYYSWPSPHNYSFSYTDSGLAPNKDINTNWC